MSHLDARDDLREMADHYETIASLDLTPEPGGAHGVPGSRVPPGMQEILDADEVKGGLREVDEWAGFCCHVLWDECESATWKRETPARLRLLGEHVGHFIDHEDELFALSFVDDLRDHLRALRKLARRGARLVRTGRECQDPSCGGHYIVELGKNPALDCDRCHHKVSNSVWTAWPQTGARYITIEHAAKIAQTTIKGVQMRASRGKWRRIGEGRDVRYLADDVRGTREATS